MRPNPPIQLTNQARWLILVGASLTLLACSFNPASTSRLWSLLAGTPTATPTPVRYPLEPDSDSFMGPACRIFSAPA